MTTQTNLSQSELLENLSDHYVFNFGLLNFNVNSNNLNKVTMLANAGYSPYEIYTKLSN